MSEQEYRRNFLRDTTLGLAGLAMAFNPMAAYALPRKDSTAKSKPSKDDRKINDVVNYICRPSVESSLFAKAVDAEPGNDIFPLRLILNPPKGTEIEQNWQKGYVLQASDALEALTLAEQPTSNIMPGVQKMWEDYASRLAKAREIKLYKPFDVKKIKILRSNGGDKGMILDMTYPLKIPRLTGLRFYGEGNNKSYALLWQPMLGFEERRNLGTLRIPRELILLVNLNSLYTSAGEEPPKRRGLIQRIKEKSGSAEPKPEPKPQPKSAPKSQSGAQPKPEQKPKSNNNDMNWGYGP